MLILKGNVDQRRVYNSAAEVHDAIANGLEIAGDDLAIINGRFLAAGKPLELLIGSTLDYVYESLRDQPLSSVFHYPTAHVLTGFNADECRRLCELAREFAFYLDLSATYNELRSTV